MHGPERLGLVAFAIGKLEEQNAQQEWEAQSEEGHLLRLSGELTLGITRRRHRLPRNIWDRQRYGGELSDGLTEVWWIIHDSNIPGRIGARYFDVIFVRETFADTEAERMRSYEAWRGFVRREWSQYLRSGWSAFLRQTGLRYPRPGRSSHSLVATQRVRNIIW